MEHHSGQELPYGAPDKNQCVTLFRSNIQWEKGNIYVQQKQLVYASKQLHDFQPATMTVIFHFPAMCIRTIQQEC
jgi:hypothetical protein